ncbi:family 2 glycosyl transferase [Natronococcus amylolyticus DSM 10524]|uniref:Family 2 glycosyl transferase n=1 Tax=Natronococcus amylolyticus DSM 10524 TaxID=1227497 RepID=L9X4K8_9EURY|nr:glycosyltransferase family 2 protein [Natronococcus amylolyticus]ELY56537.1 family 2 glycosyl transferase [Natronococcus amylolyticus DSM 10524]
MTAIDLLAGFLFGFSVFVVAYFVVANTAYLVIHLTALVELRRLINKRTFESTYQRFGSPFLPGIAIVVPAYNEAPVIVSSVQSFLDLQYPDYEVIVVNDGSSDDTLDRLVDAFDLEAVPASPPRELPCETVRDVYRSTENRKLTVIDKENGGKADALNAGVYLTEKQLFCAVDADSVIERDALLSVAKPFLEYPERTVATGGVVRVANSCSITEGIVEEIRLSRNPLVGFQTMEYLRAFLSGRIGLSSLKSLMIISGAFGLFDTRLVREVGGYRSDTITEDMELVVRMHRYLNECDQEYRLEFVPEPVIWTEVPEDRTALSRQRRRWHRGLFQTLTMHRKMIGNPNYGVTGMFALPFFMGVEGFGPLVEGLGYVIVPLAFVLGIVDTWFFISFLLLAILLSMFLSWLSVLSEVASYRRYERPQDVALLLGYGILENILYRQWKTIILWRGFVEFLRGVDSWGAMERKGFDDENGP